MRSKRATDDEHVLKVGDLVWLIDESVRRHENKMARVTEVFLGADGVIRSASIKTADGVLRRPAVKLAPVFNECFRDQNRAGDVGSRDSKNYKTWKTFISLHNHCIFQNNWLSSENPLSVLWINSMDVCWIVLILTCQKKQMARRPMKTLKLWFLRQR